MATSTPWRCRSSSAQGSASRTKTFLFTRAMTRTTPTTSPFIRCSSRRAIQTLLLLSPYVLPPPALRVRGRPCVCVVPLTPGWCVQQLAEMFNYTKRDCPQNRDRFGYRLSKSEEPHGSYDVTGEEDDWSYCEKTEDKLRLSDIISLDTARTVRPFDLKASSSIALSSCIACCRWTRRGPRAKGLRRQKQSRSTGGWAA